MSHKKTARSEKQKQVAKTTFDKTRGITIASKRSAQAVGVPVIKRATTKAVATKASSKHKPNKSSRKGPSKTASKAGVSEDGDIIMISSNDDTEPEQETSEAQSTRQLRADLADAKTTIQQLKAQADKAQRDLLAAQEKTRALQTKKDNLTSQVASTKAKQQDYIKEKLATEEDEEKKRRTLKAQVQHLTTQTTDLTSQLKHLTTEKEDVASINLQLRTENILLRDENQRLKASSSSSSYSSSSSTSAAAPPPTPQSASTSTLLSASPAPSSIAFAGEDVKLDNVRKVYSQLKRKQDSLKGIGRQIMWCTRNMVLGEFGEFGVTVRRLGEWMEEDEQQQQGTKKQR